MMVAISAYIPVHTNLQMCYKQKILVWLLDDGIHTEPLEYHTDFCEEKTQEEELAELFDMSD